MNATPYVHRYGNPGLEFLVVAGVHGNERKPPEGVLRAIHELENGGIILENDVRVSLVPVANREAYEANKRHIGGDWNRNMDDETDAKRDALRRELRQCDYLLDNHSLHCSRVPFGFVGPYDEAERAFALSTGVKHFIEGWEDAYKNSNMPVSSHQSIGTTEYARLFGAKAVTLECGNHIDPNIPQVAFKAILGAMFHLNMIKDLSPANQLILESAFIQAGDVYCARMDSVVYQLKDGELTPGLENFGAIRRGDVLARYTDGTLAKAERDGVIIMPDDRMTVVGEVPEEWYYTGVKSSLINRPA